jgi:hypothetical protein
MYDFAIIDTNGTYAEISTEAHLPHRAAGLTPQGAAESPRPGRLRKAPPRSGFEKVRANYTRKVMVEGKGFEPSTSALRTPRSPN